MTESSSSGMISDFDFLFARDAILLSFLKKRASHFNCKTEQSIACFFLGDTLHRCVFFSKKKKKDVKSCCVKEDSPFQRV